MRNVLKVIIQSCSVCLALLVLLTLYCALTLRDKGVTPPVLGIQMADISSPDMEPSLKQGTAIFNTQHFEAGNLRVGDVITFVIPDSKDDIATRRIVNILTRNSQSFFQTKGDGKPSMDSWEVPVRNVTGVYTGVSIPLLGKYLGFLQTKLGLTIAMIVPGVMILVITVFGLLRELSNLEIGNLHGRSDETNRRQFRHKRYI